jgi:alpha-glucosidase
MTMPGVPMVFAGDEVGVAGTDSDTGRVPYPWDESTWDRDLLATYRDLIALRRNSDALGRGSFRFVAAGRDALAFVRETAGERLLVHAARAPHEPLVVSAGDAGLTEAPEQLYGSGLLKFDAGRATLPGDGPAFSVWRIG